MFFSLVRGSIWPSNLTDSKRLTATSKEDTSGGRNGYGTPFGIPLLPYNYRSLDYL